jgi:hypothetical protein
MFYLFHIFRSFIPLSNPIGFGASDFVEFLIASTLVLLVLAREPLLRVVRLLARKTAFSMLALGGLTVALRLALLPRAGVPIPSAADDNSYLLLADALSHFRLANPTHPFYRFFEANFVLQQPSYSSIFPLGQGIALALGRAIFGHPWAGVLLTEAALCALCYWMLRAWVSAGWALLGGLFAVFELGPLTYWMNSYWGGAVSGIAGCLVFGSLPRLRNQNKPRDAILLGAGLGLELLTRPYECVLLTAIVALYFGLNWPNFLPAAPLVIAATLPFISLTLAQNKAVTGSWTTLPYMTSRQQYGVPTTFTFQPNPQPHRELTPEQQQDYQVQSEAHAQESARGFWSRFVERAGLIRFFVFPAFFVALPGLLMIFFQSALKRRRMILPAVAVVLFLAGASFYPYFYPHYIAALACVFLLLIVAALERIPRIAAFAVMGVATLHFVFWYGVHVSGDPDFLAGLEPFEVFDFVNHGDPEGRRPILKQLQEADGGQLVFVHYAPFRPLREWISNSADIDRAKVVWALDLGPDENRELAAYYPDRKVWLAEPDARPPRLRPYTGF